MIYTEQNYKAIGVVFYFLLFLVVIYFYNSSPSQTMAPLTPEKSTLELILSSKASVVAENLSTDNSPLFNRPRDLAFTTINDEIVLYVVNRGAPYTINEGSYAPPKGATCDPRYHNRKTPPETSQWWPSFTVIKETKEQTSVENFVDPWGIHFLAEASSIAFGVDAFSPPHHGPSEYYAPQESRATGRKYPTFATCGESRNEMKGCVDWKGGNWNATTPLDFQGPSLWTTDPEVFAKRNKVADEHLVKSFCKGFKKDSEEQKDCLNGYKKDDGSYAFSLGSHLDMLHESPMCMGVAHEKSNAYWVFDGCGGIRAQIGLAVVDGHGENFELKQDSEDQEIKACNEKGNILRYDFRNDHGAGFDDHCDGIIELHSEGKVKRVKDIPSHMVMWENKIYIADTGNNRVVVLDPAKSGAREAIPVTPNSERNHAACTVQWRMEGADRPLDTFFKGQLKNPSGIALYSDKDTQALLVTDNKTSKIYALNADGEQFFETTVKKVAPGGLMGIAVHPRTNNIYVVDAVGNRVLKFTLGGNSLLSH